MLNIFTCASEEWFFASGFPDDGSAFTSHGRGTCLGGYQPPPELKSSRRATQATAPPALRPFPVGGVNGSDEGSCFIANECIVQKLGGHGIPPSRLPGQRAAPAQSNSSGGAGYVLNIRYGVMAASVCNEIYENIANFR